MSDHPLKVMTILGTRPEIIRLARVIPALDRYTDHMMVHTGQNYDFELNELLYQDLDLRAPDIALGVDASSLGSVLGNILIAAEKVFAHHRPEAVLILGDTNSAIAAVMAKRMKIPVYHMEAGNRSFDANVPEEVNRKLVDCISDFNLVYTEHARRHLLSEGFPHRRIYLTGSPMGEVLAHHADKIENSNALERLDLEPNQYILASIHREENVDSPASLSALLNALQKAHQRFGLPVLVSTHPRTRKRLETLGVEDNYAGIQFAKPFGFIDYNRLQQDAFCVLSDSGTITEEAALLGFPAVTLRNAIERPEGMDTGSIVVTGMDAEVIVQAIATVTDYFARNQQPPVPADYQIGNVSQRVVHLITGTARLSNVWHGLRDHGSAGS